MEAVNIIIINQENKEKEVNLVVDQDKLVVKRFINIKANGVKKDKDRNSSNVLGYLCEMALLIRTYKSNV